MKQRRGLSNWLAGFVVGVVAGVLTLIFPTLGWLIVVSFLLGLVRATPRLPAIGGLFSGLGASWLVVLVRSHLECQAFDAAPNQECGDPGFTRWIVIGGVLLGIGVLVAIVALAQSRRRA